MADKDKNPPEGSFAAGMKTIDEAEKIPDDAVEIAADDAGASALAQKVDIVRDEGNSSQG